MQIYLAKKNQVSLREVLYSEGWNDNIVGIVEKRGDANIS